MFPKMARKGGVRKGGVPRGRVFADNARRYYDCFATRKCVCETPKKS